MIKDSAKTIVCYGDSNTWGSVPRSDDRYPHSVRWPSVMQSQLGDDFEVISEGLCGRTFVVTDPNAPQRTGITALQSILESADPIDLVIVMLGTNDVKIAYHLAPEDIAQHLLQTITFIRQLDSLDKKPKILIICPPAVIIPESGDLDKRMVNGPSYFEQLPKLYKTIAEKNDCGFIDASEYVSSSKIDGYHLDEKAHMKLAEVVSTWVRENI